MKPNRGDTNEKTGFTIVELLTVMSIIILLISLLVPALNRVRRFATRVKQSAQFHAIDVALEQFNAEYTNYPDSNAKDDDIPSLPYCGAMKLCEAMVGQDLRGFNPASRFRRSGFDTSNPYLGMPYPPYNTCGGGVDAPCYAENLKSRKTYLQLENANAALLSSIYDSATITVSGYNPSTFVLCDVYNRVTDVNTGKKIGMPILYYRADPTKTIFPLPGQASSTPANVVTYTYNVFDNAGLIDMGLPWLGAGPMHPMASGGITPEGVSISNYPNLFYDKIRNPMIRAGDRPYRADSYILLSAGYDGEYGTSDDVVNFRVGE